MSNANCRFLLRELIFGRPSVGWSTLPLANGNFTDCCSDSSYFIPTLRTHNWQTRCWQIYPPSSYGDFTDCCSDSSYVIPTLRAHIWQTKCWQIYCHLNGNFTYCCSGSSYFIPTLRTYIWQTRYWQIYPPHQMATIDSYSESSYLADQVLADLPSTSNDNDRFLLWELIFGRSTPPHG